MKYLWHVALGEGAKGGAAVTRDHMSDEQIAAWRGHIDAALESTEPVNIPGVDGYAVAARIISGSLLCTVGRTDDATALCTFAVVAKSKHAVKVWQALHEGHPEFARSLDDAPHAPYCAVRAEQGMAFDQGAAQWLDAYQIAIAWAWLIGGKANA